MILEHNFKLIRPPLTVSIQMFVGPNVSGSISKPHHLPLPACLPILSFLTANPNYVLHLYCPCGSTCLFIDGYLECFPSFWIYSSKPCGFALHLFESLLRIQEQSVYFQKLAEGSLEVECCHSFNPLRHNYFANHPSRNTLLSFVFVFLLEEKKT